MPEGKRKEKTKFSIEGRDEQRYAGTKKGKPSNSPVVRKVPEGKFSEISG